ncbi:Receptor-type tyrosine-protein phosphatase F [Geodia barretti]|uniref:protein-tyrosine-phosphatase n=1 Tax=Geodia barretti TaxID=519541 RepID=A0AA35TI90_GEOBA|nr:Receptor-type tyrosine-protein phosphatase F [Geodia barretti]
MSSTAISVEWEGLTQCELVNGLIVKYRVVFRAETGGVQSTEQSGTWDSSSNVSLSGLTPSTNYFIQVAAVNEEGDVGQYSDTISVRTRLLCSDYSWQCVAAAVPVGAFLVVIVITIVLLTVFRYKNKCKRNSKKHTSVDYEVIPLDNLSEHDGNGPRILQFPANIVRVVEGERVEFTVKVTGSPEPKLTWYHEGEEVMTNYSTDVGLDGCLSIPCTESSHTGLYQLVAVNPAGRAERQVTLFVRKEEQPTQETTENNQVLLSPVPVLDFEEYVASGHANDNAIFQEQFNVVDEDPDHPMTIGTDPDSILLNRFANITVYDDNRIVLMPIDGNPDCQRDYINACYIDGYKHRKKFIATQGPLVNTVVDFWRLVWQERPPTIVMLTDVKEKKKVKCYKYWPDSGTRSFGPFRVTITEQQRLVDYTTRNLLLELKGRSERALNVTQLHYMAWPEHGVPTEPTSLLAFHRRLKKLHQFPKRPILVHCSAGVGRTGTLITIDCVLEQLLKERLVDVAGTIKLLRTQRMKMVQNLEQFIFIHDAILEELVCGETQIDASGFTAAMDDLSQQHILTNTTGFEKQFKALSKLSPKPQNKPRKSNWRKNRNSVFLQSLDGRATELENEVVFVNGYKQKKAFIVAQSPSHSSARDFWKMVYDMKCGVIVNLNTLEEITEEVFHQYWPDESGVMKVGEFLVDSLQVEQLPSFCIRSFSVFPEKVSNRLPVFSHNCAPPPVREGPPSIPDPHHLLDSGWTVLQPQIHRRHHL